MQTEWKNVGVISKFYQVSLQEGNLQERLSRSWEDSIGIRMDLKGIDFNAAGSISHVVNSTSKRPTECLDVDGKAM